MNVPSRPPLVRHLTWPVGTVMLALSVAMVARNPFTTYGGLGRWWRWSEVVAAGALVVLGVVAGRGRRRLAMAAAVTGMLWLAPEWAGWTAGPAWVRAVGDASSGPVLAGAVTTVAFAAVLAAPVQTLLTRAAVGGAVLVALPRLLLLDPFADPRCWRRCTHSPLAIDGADSVGRLVERVGVAVLAITAVAVLVSIVWRSARRQAPAVSWFKSVGAAALLVGLTAPAVLRFFTTENPDYGPFAMSFASANAGAVAVAVALCVEWSQERRLGSALFQLVEDVRAAPPGSLESALARTVGDPSLQLLYWSAAQDGYVDGAGRPASLPDGGGRTVTAVVRRGLPVAALVHRVTIDGGRIERAIGPAVRLSLENEQLRAATLAELAELKASRARVVERGDAERRRLERNLHDGAQQRVVGIALLLRTVRPRLVDLPGAPSRALLARAEELIASILNDLRRLAVGISPAVLADGGLRAAVPDLAESSADLAIRIDALPAGRQPSGVETAAYLVVAEAVAEARRRAATTVTVSAEEHGSTLTVELVDDAPLGTDGHALSDLDDRVGALDGHLSVTSTAGTGTRVHLELPCGS